MFKQYRAGRAKSKPETKRGCTSASSPSERATTCSPNAAPAATRPTIQRGWPPDGQAARDAGLSPGAQCVPCGAGAHWPARRPWPTRPTQRPPPGRSCDYGAQLLRNRHGAPGALPVMPALRSPRNLGIPGSVRGIGRLDAASGVKLRGYDRRGVRGVRVAEEVEGHPLGIDVKAMARTAPARWSDSARVRAVSAGPAT